MTSPLFYIYLFLTSFTCFVAPHIICAQEGADSLLIQKQSDSIEAKLDSLTGYSSNSDLNEDIEDTLFFSSKDDSTSLYDSSAIENRFVPDSVTKQLKGDNAFWYANKDLHAENKKTGNASIWKKILIATITLLNSPVFRQLLWIIMLVLFAAIVIWFLIQNKMNIFGSGKAVALATQLQAGDMDNIFTTNLQQARDNAAEKGDYRLAIRFAYLQLLKTFSEHGLIIYATDTTNSEYLTQLYQKHYFQEFFTVTRSYEYAWYGKMFVTRQQYENIQNDFTLLYQKSAISI